MTLNQRYADGHGACVIISSAALRRGIVCKRCVAQHTPRLQGTNSKRRSVECLAFRCRHSIPGVSLTNRYRIRRMFFIYHRLTYCRSVALTKKEKEKKKVTLRFCIFSSKMSVLCSTVSVFGLFFSSSFFYFFLKNATSQHC